METTDVSSSRLNGLFVAIAYLMVITIWSTTPLTIKWSSEGVSFIFGIVARMAVGGALACSLALLFYKKIVFNKKAVQAYFAVAVAMFGGMLPVYWGAQYISSGLISVIFGLSPMFTGYLAWRFTNEQSFSGVKIIGLLVGVAGLVVIFSENIYLGENYLYGISSVLMAVIMHSVSAVWIKRIKVEIPSISIVAGGLLFSMPLFATVYLVFAPALPSIIPHKVLWSIVYLGVVGSVIGFVCYYFLLKQLPASKVALITLVTPVLSLWIGSSLNNEVISFSIYVGTVFVLLGLALHQWGDLLSKKVWKKRKLFYG